MFQVERCVKSVNCFPELGRSLQPTGCVQECGGKCECGRDKEVFVGQKRVEEAWLLGGIGVRMERI